MLCTRQIFLQYIALLLLLLSACVLVVFGAADDKTALIIGGIVCAVFAAFVYAGICWQTIRKARQEIDGRPIIIIRSPVPAPQGSDYPIPGTLYPLTQAEVPDRM